MKLSIKHYTALSIDEFHDIIALRMQVFVVEQDCPYQDLDGKDKDAYHLIAEIEGTIVGTLRLLKPGKHYMEVAIGRVVSHADYRDRKIGHQMMAYSMDYINDQLKLYEVRLSAQSHLTGYYGRYGFESTGKEYLEDGIPHTEMLFTKSNP
jgi:ElaA protein